MSPPPKQPEILARLAEDKEIAAEAIFAEMCRSSDALRVWLVESFGRSAKTRATFIRALDDGAYVATNGEGMLTRLNGEDRAIQEEKAWQRQYLRDTLYGGLKWNEMVQIVRHYQAGSLDLGTFMLAREWRGSGDSAKTDPTLIRAGMELLDAVIRGRQKRLLKHLAKSIAFLQDFEAKGPERRAAIGYSDWWKLCTLFYMLRHPRECYRTREVRRHLSSLGIEVSRLDFQRFCKRHGIKRDIRGGRPRRHSAQLQTPGFISRP